MESPIILKKLWNKVVRISLDTGLFHAIDRGEYEAVLDHLEKGADVNSKNYEDETVLMVASRLGYFEIVRLLLERGADVNSKNYEDETALLLASSNGHFDVVLDLLGAGAALETKNRDGDTALSLAKRWNKTEVIDLLEHAIERQQLMSPLSIEATDTLDDGLHF